jgi:competence protein ComEA
MRRFLVDYFFFTRGERNGTLVLAALMVLVFVFPYIYNALKGPSEYQADPDFIKEIRAFYGLQDNGGHVPDSSGVTDTKKLPADRAAGGGDTRQGRYDPGPGLGNIDQPVRDNRIEINSADTTELMRIRGIGPVFSRRIVRYREILGGYHNVAQLLEVYGMDEGRYVDTEPFVYADTTLVTRLRPLEDEFGTLLRHPYLDYEQVSEIFRLRRSGGLKNAEDLLQSALFTGQDITRLSPYLAFD